ncbi:MAG: aminotransferase class I/II-fold pyridoxal phosphate-dependent enzyme [Geminicoccaceae bacterium]
MRLPKEPERSGVSGRSAIEPFLVMQVLAAANKRAAEGGDVLHLEVGEPSGGAPRAALDAARAALDGSALGYSEAFGLRPLRTAIARHIEATYARAVPIERIAITAGASGGFILAFLAAFDAGARVAVAEPGYPAYRNILKALDIEVVKLVTSEASGFQPTVADLEAIDGPLDGVIVASPANPTGSLIDPAELAAIARWCDARGVRLISDEIYHGITYGRPGSTALASSTRAIVVNSFSKYWAMTGWRIGWLVLPDELVDPVERLAQNLFISPSAVGQHAAIGALGAKPELDARVAGYGENRALLLDALPRIGLDRLVPPDGAFYLYADIGRFGLDSVDFCARLLADTGVAITPGNDFDVARGNHYVRLSFAGARTTIEQAIDRLGPWLARLDRR